MLNKSKGNMYPWVTHTWNPLAGECKGRCSYCYVSTMKRQYPLLNSKYSGDIRLIEKEFITNLGKDNKIFVCSMIDIFYGSFNMIKRILDYCMTFDNEYFFQSKRPTYFSHFEFPDRTIIGTTLETNRYENENERGFYFSRIDFGRKYVSVEPILDFDLDEFVSLIKKINPEFVSIGADSCNNNLIEPPRKKIIQLISELKDFTQLKIKSNLNRLLK